MNKPLGSCDIFLFALCGLLTLSAFRIFILCGARASFASNTGGVEQRFNDPILQNIAKDIADKQYINQIALVKFEDKILIGAKISDMFDENEIDAKSDIVKIMERNRQNINNIKIIYGVDAPDEVIELSQYLNKKLPRHLLRQRFNYLYEAKSITDVIEISD